MSRNETSLGDGETNRGDGETNRSISEIEDRLSRAILRRRIYLLIGVVGFLLVLLFVPEQKSSLPISSCGSYNHHGLIRSDATVCMPDSTTTGGSTVLESSIFGQELVGAQRYAVTDLANGTKVTRPRTNSKTNSKTNSRADSRADSRARSLQKVNRALSYCGLYRGCFDDLRIISHLSQDARPQDATKQVFG